MVMAKCWRWTSCPLIAQRSFIRSLVNPLGPLLLVFHANRYPNRDCKEAVVTSGFVRSGRVFKSFFHAATPVCHTGMCCCCSWRHGDSRRHPGACTGHGLGGAHSDSWSPSTMALSTESVVGTPPSQTMALIWIASLASHSPYRVVGDIFKCWGHWTDDDETDLQLFEYEFLAYSNPEFGGDKRLLEFSDVANTFLHSYGNALMSCPCNCRQSWFSRQFLERKGLRGCFVQPRVHHNPRYLHPRELGLLLGLPNSLEYPFRPREHLFLDL